MKLKNKVHWPEFSEELIQREIKEKRQWKILIEGQIGCIWTTSLKDELIWGHQDNDSSIYIHRIATSPNFRGQNFVKKLLSGQTSIVA